MNNDRLGPQQGANENEGVSHLPQPGMRSSTKEWINIGVILTTLVTGGIIGYILLPRDLSTIGLWIGGILLCCLAGTLGYVIEDVRKHDSYYTLLWWFIGLLSIAAIGALLGNIFLPKVLSAPLKIIGGVLSGLAIPGIVMNAYHRGVALDNKRSFK